MTILTVSPQYPIGGMKARLSLAGADAACNFVRYSVTAAPDGSALRKKLDDSERDRSQVHQGDLATPFELAVDKGGLYTFLVEEFTRGAAANGGGYEDSPQNASADEKLAETSLVLQVGERLDIKLGSSQDAATLRFYVWGDTIRATTIAVHDIETPAIVNPTSARAANAAQDSSLVAAVDALVGVTATTVIGNVSTSLDDLIAKLNAHLANVTAHNSADTENTLDSGYTSSTVDALPANLTAFRRALEAHMSDTDATGPGEGGYHDASDNRNKFAAAGASPDPLSQMIALADCWRIYEAHRVTASGVHNSADSTNAATAMAALPNIHRLFLVALSAPSPAAPDTVNPGAALIRHKAGAITA